MEGVIQSKVMGRMVSFAEDIQHAAQQRSPGAAHGANKGKLGNEGLYLAFSIV